RRIELLRAPLFVAPIPPVLDDHVEREAAPPELAHDAEQLGGAVIALAALPIAVRPFRQQRHGAGRLAVARDYAVGARSLDEIVVDPFRGCGPEPRGPARGARGQPPQVEGPVRVAPSPLDLEAIAAVRLEPHPGRLVG